MDYFNGLPEQEQTQLSDELSSLPGYGYGSSDASSFTFLRGKESIILRQLDLDSADGGQISVYLLTMASGKLPGAQLVIVQYVLAILSILIVTAIFLTAWIYSGFVPQVRKLTKAA